MRRRSALFILFTVTLLITHIRLIVLNQSTVDSLKAQHMKERENAVLARQFSWYQFGCVLHVKASSEGEFLPRCSTVTDMPTVEQGEAKTAKAVGSRVGRHRYGRQHLVARERKEKLGSCHGTERLGVVP